VKRRLGGWCELVVRKAAIGREPPFREDFSPEAEE
jgi:hypothetical protein